MQKNRRETDITKLADSKSRLTEKPRTFLSLLSAAIISAIFCYRKFRVNIKLLVVCGKSEKYFAVHVMSYITPL